MVLNLGEVSYIDSGGLGQLVSSFGSLAKTNGGLKLLHVNKRNHDLLSITRLVTIFDTYDSEEEAIKSFDKPAEVGGPAGAASSARTSLPAERGLGRLRGQPREQGPGRVARQVRECESAAIRSPPPAVSTCTPAIDARRSNGDSIAITVWILATGAMVTLRQSHPLRSATTSSVDAHANRCTCL